MSRAISYLFGVMAVLALTLAMSSAAADAGANRVPAVVGDVRQRVAPYVEHTKRDVTAAAARLSAALDAAGGVIRGTAEKLSASVPSPCNAIARDLFRGALSVVTAGGVLSPAAAGYGAVDDDADAVREAGQRAALRTHTTSKFLYAMGGSAAELLLLKLLYREPHGNRRRNRRVLAFLSSPLGFSVLVAVLAIPNGIAPVSLLAVLLLHLCDAVYVPAIFIANVVRPYMVAALHTCTGVRTALDAIFGTNSGGNRQEQAGLGHVVETLLWLSVVGAIFFLAAAQDRSGASDSDDVDAADMSDSQDDDEAEEQERVEPLPAASKQRVKKAAKGVTAPKKSRSRA